MRFFVPLLAVLGLALGASTAVPAAASADGGYVLALDQQPSGTLDVNIDISEGGGDWWANPIWIGIGSRWGPLIFDPRARRHGRARWWDDGH